MNSPVTQKRLERNLCECRTPLYNLQATVLCVCGRKIHQRCAVLIRGAYHCKPCAKAVNEGGVVAQHIPGVVA